MLVGGLWRRTSRRSLEPLLLDPRPEEFDDRHRHFLFFARTFARSRIIFERSSGENLAHAWRAPLPAAAFPPRRPSATAAGFLRFAMRASLASRRSVLEP